jgi:perosamine synthetase
MKINIKKNKNFAFYGGKKIRSKEWQNNITTSKEEVDAVIRVIKNGNLSLFEGSHNADKPFSFNGGPWVKKLEKNWSKYYKSKNAISFNSATSCLFASVGALGIGFGDEVIVSPYTMTACAIAPLIYGAIPVFADVENETGCLDPNSIEKRITKRTKAIIVVHQFGFPANMEKIMKIAKKKKIKIIEDCAQAHGSKFKGRHVGTFGEIGIFSLNVNKTIQTGEGGVCITNSKEISFRLRLIRNHGEAVVGPAKYKNITNIAGFNYRMTELTAAIAIKQLNKLKKLNSYRLNLVKYFLTSIKKYNFLEPLVSRKECKNCNCKKGMRCVNTFYILPIRYKKKFINLNRKKFIDIINFEGAKFYTGYTKPLYLQPLYQKKHLFKFGYPFSAKENIDAYMNYKKGLAPVAENLYFKEMILNEHIRYPHKKRDIDDILNIFNKICKI